MLRKLIYRIRRFFRLLLQQDCSPGYQARGLGIGVFCGCFPLFGLQSILGLALASLLRGNQLFAVSGTWISNPVTYLPLYWLNYRVGAALLGHDINLQDISEFVWRDIWGQGLVVASRLLLGSALVGAFLGIFISLIVYFSLKLRLR